MITIDDIFSLSCVGKDDEKLNKFISNQEKPLIFDSVIIYSSREILESILLSTAEYNYAECFFYLRINLLDAEFYIKIMSDKRIYPNPGMIERNGERFIFWEVFCRAEDKLSIQFITRYIYREIVKKIGMIITN